ncbi:unnamed protein product [Sphagnum jensenii]|uniref:Coiled-coil domain-containing protein 22 homolog n=1 Tax=Sphagnum jensenii TaxID=128206 RepID=A0ABP1AYN2_9BRYO
MDDAQQIVLVALEQAGLEVPAEVKNSNGQELGSKALVSICSQAVALLLSRGVSSSSSAVAAVFEVPQGTAERFRFCTDLAAAIKQLGYQADLSFHQFLYPSHTDTHRLLRFLLDQLSKTSSAPTPRTRKGRAEAQAPKLDKLSATVQQALVHWHASRHTAEGYDEVANAGLPFRTSALRLFTGKNVVGNLVKKPTLVTLQAKPREWLLPSILELNARNAVRSAGLADAQLAQLLKQVEGTEKRGETKVISHGVLLSDRGSGDADNVTSTSVLERGHLFRQDQELEEAQERLINEGQDQASEQRHINIQLQEKLLQLVEQADKKAVSLALEPSSSPSSVLQELRAQLSASEDHLTILQAEWDTVKVPLEEKKTELEKSALVGKGELQEKLKQMKEMRHKLKQLSTTLRAREEELWSLKAEVEKAGSAPKRSSYVHRISELVRNSQKQANDITRIIQDTRNLQRENNSAHDRLRRVHALVDELVFRDAKQDAVCRQAYRLLSIIHETFADIVDRVFEMDKTSREIAELQAKLEELEKSPVDIVSVQSDLDMVVAENQIMERRLAELQAVQ